LSRASLSAWLKLSRFCSRLKIAPGYVGSSRTDAGR
jgi:hypothetical protein